MNLTDIVLTANIVKSGAKNLGTFKDVQRIVREGRAASVFHIGDQIVTERMTAINATVGNTEGETAGITAATVNSDTFLEEIGTAHSGDYEFIFDGAEWHLDSVPVVLANYGIAVTGTPIRGDAVIVHETADKIAWDIIGIDEDTPTNPSATHSLTLGMHDVFSDLQFSPKQALFAFANGLAAGAYKFTIGAQPWHAGDVNKVVTFTLTSAIPTGGQLVINNAYNATMIGATISAFASSTATTAAETVTMSEATEETEATDLGTVTDAGTPTDGINSIHCALLGYNNWAKSSIRQWLNSSAAAGSVWTPQTAFDRPPSWVSSAAGFMHGLDPDFVSVLGTVEKYTLLNTVTDGGGRAQSAEKMFLLSQSEVYAGDAVTGGEGAPYSYYKDFSDLPSAGDGADTNRIKRRNGITKYWWVRTSYPSSANYDRGINPSGALYNYNASYSLGVSPACCII